jgi:hypothetical protein
MAQKMMQGLVDRPRVLLGLGQPIEVGEEFIAAAIQLEVELPTRVSNSRSYSLGSLGRAFTADVSFLGNCWPVA